jgi:hypothetical protein
VVVEMNRETYEASDDAPLLVTFVASAASQ